MPVYTDKLEHEKYAEKREELNFLLREGMLNCNGDSSQLNKIGAATREFVRTRVREGSVLNKIIPNTTITLDELKIDPKTRTHYYLAETISPTYSVTAAPIGMAVAAPVKAGFVSVPRITFESKVVTYTKRELEVFQTNIMQKIEEDIIKDLRDKVDGMFYAMVQQGLTALSGLGHNHRVSQVTPLDKPKFVYASDVVRDDKGELYPYLGFLMTKSRYKDIIVLDHEQIGNDQISKYFNGELTSPSLYGMSAHFTNKSSIFPDDKVLYFIDEFANNDEGIKLGWNMDINDIQFTVHNPDGHGKTFEVMATWDKIMGIANIYGLGELTLTTT